MAKCPNGHENSEGQRFCGECGERIAPTESTAPDTAASPTAGGEDEYPSQGWQQPPKRPKGVRKAPFWITIGIIVFVVIVVTSIVGAVTGSGNKAKPTAERAAATTTPCSAGEIRNALGDCISPRTAAPTLPPPPTAPPTTAPPTTAYVPPPPPSVTYDLTGQGSVSVTLQNASGGTEQFETGLPYHLDLGPAGTFGGLSGFVYISAQLQSSGSVTCEIKKGGQVIQTATSTGQYVIASCSGSV